MDLYTNASSLHVGAHVTKAYVGVEVHVQFDAFITSAVNGDQLHASHFTLISKQLIVQISYKTVPSVLLPMSLANGDLHL